MAGKAKGACEASSRGTTSYGGDDLESAGTVGKKRFGEVKY